MLIVLEGCDGVGKSTIVESLAGFARSAGMGVTLLHKGKPEHDDPFIEYETELVDYAPGKNELVLCDRWHWGEAIYGPRYRGKSLLDEVGLRHIDLFLRTRGALQVLLDLPAAIVQQRLSQRGDDLVDIDHVPDIMEKYRVLVANMGQHVLTVDPTSRAVTEALFASAVMCDEYAMAIPRTKTYVGPASPEMLLLGESRGLPPDPNEILPAFVPRHGTSGRYLLTALERAGIPPTYGMANVLEDDWVSLWHALGEPRVVALGTTAHHEADRHRVPHGWTQHPQYVRRFMHGRPMDYGHAILTAARERRKVWLT